MKNKLDVQTSKAYANGLHHFLKSPQGQKISQMFINVLKDANIITQGHHMMQFGGSKSDLWLQTLPHQHIFHINAHASRTQKNLICEPEHLPLNRNAIDCAIMPLFLEGYDGNLCALFNELDRVLKSSGTLIIWGINPLGSWGCLKFLHLLNTPSHKLHLHFPIALKKVLTHRGFHVEYLKGFYFLPPIQSLNTLNRLELVNEVGMMLSPFPASFYCMVLKKRDTIPKTPIFDITHSLAMNRSLYNC